MSGNSTKSMSEKKPSRSQNFEAKLIERADIWAESGDSTWLLTYLVSATNIVKAIRELE